MTPDLTCLGKIIGGGLPVAAYGGRGDRHGSRVASRADLSGWNAVGQSAGDDGGDLGARTADAGPVSQACRDGSRAGVRSRRRRARSRRRAASQRTRLDDHAVFHVSARARFPISGDLRYRGVRRRSSAACSNVGFICRRRSSKPGSSRGRTRRATFNAPSQPRVRPCSRSGATNSKGAREGALGSSTAGVPSAATLRNFCVFCVLCGSSRLRLRWT